MQPEFAVETAIRIKRERLGLSRRELGKRAHLSPAYVSALESGRIIPSLRTFARLACELRLSPLELQLIVAAEATREKPSVTPPAHTEPEERV